MPGVYIPNKKFAFVHVPKTAGMSIENWLSKNTESEKILGHPSLNDMKDRWDIERHFIVVRNPWDWVVSGYTYFKTIMTGVWKINGWENFPTFEKMILDPPKELNVFFEGNGNPVKTWHDFYTNQIEWVHNQTDIVLRFENLKEDFKQIQSILDCDKELEHINSSKHNHYKEYYNDKTKQQVAKMFERDIDIFKYTFEGN